MNKHRAIIIHQDGIEIFRYDINNKNNSLESDLADSIIFMEHGKGLINSNKLIKLISEKKKINIIKYIKFLDKPENCIELSKDIINELKLRFSKENIRLSMIEALK